MGDEDSIFDQAEAEFIKNAIEDGPYTIPEYAWSWPDNMNTHNDVVLTSAGEEMIRINDKGFYVRGKKIKQDKEESKKVYKAFREWLTYAILKGKDSEDE